MRSAIKSWTIWTAATVIGAIEGITGLDRATSEELRRLREELSREKARHAYPARYAPILSALQCRAEFDPQTVLARYPGPDGAPLTVAGMAEALQAGEAGAVQFAEDAICVAVRMIMRPGPSPVSPDGVFAPEGWEWRNDDDDAGDRLCLYAPGDSGMDYYAAAYLDGSWTAYIRKGAHEDEEFAMLDMGPLAPADPAFQRQAQIDAVKALRRAGVFT